MYHVHDHVRLSSPSHTIVRPQPVPHVPGSKLLQLSNSWRYHARGGGRAGRGLTRSACQATSRTDPSCCLTASSCRSTRPSELRQCSVSRRSAPAGDLRCEGDSRRSPTTARATTSGIAPGQTLTIDDIDRLHRLLPFGRSRPKAPRGSGRGHCQ
jgi:hypothetical protein